MAQLKDLIVSGVSRLIGDAFATSLQTNILKIPTNAGGTTYGTGTNGQVLKTNGTTVYWGTDNDTTYTLAGLMGSSAKGSGTQPVYWNGSAWTNTTYTLGASVPSGAKFTDTTYSAGTGISLSGTTFSNSGVRSIATGGTNGTISVNTNGTSADVAVKGLGSAAYTASTAYAAASHTHSYLPLSGGAMTGTATWGGNVVALNFRTGHTSYDACVTYNTAGNEALLFTTKSTVTGMMFVNGEDIITNNSSSRFQSLTPGLLVRNNSVVVGKAYATSNPIYKFEVNGTSYFNNTITLGSSGGYSISADGSTYSGNAATATNATNHIADKNNPHAVTAAQIGAATSDHTHTFASLTSKPTTLSGYGITDAKIASGVITLGSATITPLTSSSSLAASKLSGSVAIANGGTGATTAASALTNLGAVGSVTATGTAPLSLAASKSGSAVAITGSVAEASATASGVVTTTTQTFAGDKTFNNTVTVGNAGCTLNFDSTQKCLKFIFNE